MSRGVIMNQADKYFHKMTKTPVVKLVIMLNAMIDVSDKLREKYDKVKIDITDIIQKLKTL